MKSALRGLVLFFVACTPAEASPPTIEVPKSKPVPVESAPPPVPANPLQDWHWRKPEAEADKTEGGKPLYLAVDSMRDMAAGGCHVGRAAPGKAYVMCEHDIGRVTGSAIDFAWGDAVPFHDYLPSTVHEEGNRLWVTATTGTDGAFDPFFGVTSGIMVQTLPNGAWQRFETDERPMRYGSGWILGISLPAKENSKCPDGSCLGIVPKFATFDSEHKPDFSALSGKIAWIHPQTLDDDFNVAIDADGPVYVLMHALDLKTKKRGFGIASWTPKGGAKFDWLPAPLDSIAGGGESSSTASATHGEATLDLVVDAKGKTTTYFLLFDGKKWSLGKDPRPNRVFTIEAPAAERTVTEIGPDDVWVDEFGSLYRTRQPDEVFVQIERWGRVHPFARPADDACRTPFAVLDRMEKNMRDGLVARGGASWGVVEEGLADRLVEMETEDLVVFGIPFSSTAEAKAFLDRTPWEGGRDGLPTPHVVVCARPVKPKPFKRSK